MAKHKYYEVGSVVKAKDADQRDYIQIRGGAGARALAEALLKLDSKSNIKLSLDTKKSQLERLEASASSGKITGQYLEDRRKTLNNIPDFVRFIITLKTDG